MHWFMIGGCAVIVVLALVIIVKLAQGGTFGGLLRQNSVFQNWKFCGIWRKRRFRHKRTKKRRM